MWLFASVLLASLLFFVVYQQGHRTTARGDSCAACEAARAHYRKRVEKRKHEVAAGG